MRRRKQRTRETPAWRKILLQTLMRNLQSPKRKETKRVTVLGKSKTKNMKGMKVEDYFSDKELLEKPAQQQMKSRERGGECRRSERKLTMKMKMQPSVKRLG